MIQLVTSTEQQRSPSNSLPIGSRWRGLEVTHVELDEAIEKLVKFWWGGFSPGLILAGNTGSGKTSLSERVFNWADSRRLQSEMVNEPDLLGFIRDGYSNGKSDGYIEWLSWQDLLVIDDVGAANIGKKEWYHDIWWRLLNNRHKYDRKTILTTNLLPKELGERVGVRANSRLKEIITPGYYCLMFGVPDYRAMQYKAKQELIAA